MNYLIKICKIMQNKKKTIDNIIKIYYCFYREFTLIINEIFNIFVCFFKLVLGKNKNISSLFV